MIWGEERGVYCIRPSGLMIPAQKHLPSGQKVQGSLKTLFFYDVWGMSQRCFPFLIIDSVFLWPQSNSSIYCCVCPKRPFQQRRPVTSFIIRMVQMPSLQIRSQQTSSLVTSLASGILKLSYLISPTASASFTGNVKIRITF